eukprot:TRINITY_DN13777_c0_g2_i1.p1 TRINITY_DN13777_c0_g2~~TRINITY_DN13777_c0_g2_i1.p1  ORF type:complete len:184 (+),score=7.31 TRINITY_DN13777_c0_g2_i1:90-641(+)
MVPWQVGHNISHIHPLGTNAMYIKIYFNPHIHHMAFQSSLGKGSMNGLTINSTNGCSRLKSCLFYPCLQTNCYLISIYIEEVWNSGSIHRCDGLSTFAPAHRSLYLQIINLIVTWIIANLQLQTIYLALILTELQKFVFTIRINNTFVKGENILSNQDSLLSKSPPPSIQLCSLKSITAAQPT